MKVQNKQRLTVKMKTCQDVLQIKGAKWTEEVLQKALYVSLMHFSKQMEPWGRCW